MVPGVSLFSRFGLVMVAFVVLPEENRRKRNTQAMMTLCKIFMLIVTGEPPLFRSSIKIIFMRI